MNASNFYHAGLAVLAQVVIASAATLLFCIPMGAAHFMGGMFSVGFYFGREVAQAERKAGTPPWWSGFVFSKWSRDAFFDFVCPLAACTAVWLIAVALES